MTEPKIITLTEKEARLALGWSMDRDWPPMGEDEQALQDRLRPFAPSEPCPFCEIIAGSRRAEIKAVVPPDIIAEIKAVALPDIIMEPLNPVTPGHLMVIPGQHVEDFTSDVHVTSRIMGLAGTYAREFGGQWNLITSKGANATQTVFHFHVHLVPRHKGDGLHLPWTGQEH